MKRIKNASICNEQTTFFTGGETSRLQHSYCRDSTNKEFLIAKLQQLQSILKTSISQNKILKHNSSKLQKDLQQKLFSIQRINERDDNNLENKMLLTEELDLNFSEKNQYNNFSFKNQVCRRTYKQNQYYSMLPSPIKRKEQNSGQRYKKPQYQLSSVNSQKKLVGRIQKQKTNNRENQHLSMGYKNEIQNTHRKNFTTNFQTIDDIWNKSSLEEDLTKRNKQEKIAKENIRKKASYL